MEHCSVERSPFSFDSRGDILRGVVHTPVEPGDTALIIIHGWGTCRLGPERAFVRFSDRLAEAGVTVYRYDLPGRGESEGEYTSVTVDRMASSAEDCGAYIRGIQPSVTSLGMCGICSGANTAVLSSCSIDTDFLLLWSMFPFKSSAPLKTKAVKTGGAAGIYFRKLFHAATWRKLFTGTLQFRKIFGILFGHFSKERTDLQRTEIPVYEKWKTYPGKILFIYGERDPEAEYSREHYTAFVKENSLDAEFRTIPGASHNFYRREWQEELFRLSEDFISGISG